MRYQVKNLDTGAEMELSLETAFRPLVTLPVPFVSQSGPGADALQNDSGAAAAVMLLRAYQPHSAFTPEVFATRFALPGDAHFTLPQLRAALSSLRILTDLRNGMSMQDLFVTLAAGKPLLAALQSQTLAEVGWLATGRTGPHFVVIVGLDLRSVYLHDPSCADGTAGAGRALSLETFWKAWRETATEPQVPIPERSALVPTIALGFRLTRQVRVNIPTLNVRKEPALHAQQVGTLRKGQVVDIVREVNGWGEVPGTGWILLSYTVAAGA